MSANHLAFLFKRSDSGRGNHQRLPPPEMIIIIFILNKSQPTLDFLAYLKRLNSVSVTVSRSLSPPQAYWFNFFLNSPNLGGVFWGVRGKYSHPKIEKSLTNYGQSSGAELKPLTSR